MTPGAVVLQDQRDEREVVLCPPGACGRVDVVCNNGYPFVIDMRGNAGWRCRFWVRTIAGDYCRLEQNTQH